jgi:DNA-binding GntR family transcriptional regulator
MQDDCQQADGSRWPSIRRRSLADEVTDQLRDVILTGGLQPADHVGEVEISQRLRVSRGPVREALVRLEQEGLVSSELHRGATVVDFARADIAQLATLRAALEELAMSEAARNATDADLAKLDDVVERMRSVRTTDAEISLVRLDVEFHDLVYQTARHDRLYAAWATIRSQVTLSLLRRRVLNQDYAALVVDEHAALASTLASRDAAQARSEGTVHVQGAYTRLLAAYDGKGFK